MRKIKLILILLFTVLLSSCGLFLQKTGLKNYELQIKFSSEGLNDFQYDFIYLTKLLDEGFPNIDSIFPEKERLKLQNEIIQKLSNSNPGKTDFVIQCRKYLSKFHNQHTNIYLKSTFEKVYPFIIHIYENKWYLLNIDNTKDSLLISKQISHINGVTVNNIENLLINYTFAENKINQQFEIRSTRFYNKPELFKEIGLIATLNDSIKITFQDSSLIYLNPIHKDSISLFDIKFPEWEITEPVNKTYFYETYPKQNFVYLQYNKCHDKIDILEGIESYVKPWLQPLARTYVKWQFKKKKPSKMIAAYYNPEYPIFKDFLWELIDSLNNNHIDNLVIDLRNNPGGNLTLGIQLLYFLTERIDLKGFKEYIYTSAIYKHYQKKDFEELEKEYIQRFGKPVPDNKLVLTNFENNNLFKDIMKKSSPYYVSPNRPIFKGKVYIMANYKTGSAAAMLTTLAQDNKIAMIIGTSVGNNPIGATTWTPFKLPKTKARVSVATTYIERPDMKAGKIQIPDYWIEYSVYDLLKRKDPFFEKVIDLISNE